MDVLITGANRGIGLALARQAAAGGARVTGTCRGAEPVGVAGVELAAYLDFAAAGGDGGPGELAGDDGGGSGGGPGELAGDGSSGSEGGGEPADAGGLLGVLLSETEFLRRFGATAPL